MSSTQLPKTKHWGLRQPGRGLFILVVSLLVALGIATLWAPDTLQGAPFGFVLCLVPQIVVMGLFWKGWPAEKFEQPARGILLLILTALIGIVSFMWTKLLIGGGHLSPVTNMYGVTVVTLLVIIGPLLGLWPLAGKLSKPFDGIGWLILIFGIGFILFRTLFNFDSLSAAAWYNAAVFPHGRFPADVPFAVIVMGLPFAYALLHFGMWPLAGLKQPWLGLSACAVVWILALILYLVMTEVFGLGATEAQVKFGVYGVFGMMIWSNMFEIWPGSGWPQPMGGLIRILLSLGVSAGMFYLIRSFGFWLFPDSAALEGEGLYRWMGTVALGLCFPFFAMYTGMFQSWPLPLAPSQSSMKD
jgi:hypothetical protein